MGRFASLADVKAEANVTSSASDGELSLRLDAAEDLVADLVGDFSLRSVTERVHNVSGTVILSGRPTGGVTLNGGDVTGFTTAADAGLLYDVPAVYGPLEATYTTGGTVPAAVTLATAIIAAHLWETQRGNGPGVLALQGNDGFDGAITPGAGFALPNRAKELLAPYVRNTQVG